MSKDVSIFLTKDVFEELGSFQLSNLLQLRKSEIIDVKWFACWKCLSFNVGVLVIYIWKRKVGIYLDLWIWLGCGCNVDREEAAAVLLLLLQISVACVSGNCLNMSSDSRSRSRSRSPLDRKIRTVRDSYRDAPYRRERRGFRLFRFPSIISCSVWPFH